MFSYVCAATSPHYSVVPYPIDSKFGIAAFVPSSLHCTCAICADASLRELAELVKDVVAEARDDPRVRLTFSLVYPNSSVRLHVLAISSALCVVVA